MTAGVNVNQTETDGAATVTVPIEFGVGLSKAISLGLYLEPGRYLDSSATESNGMVMLGLQPRFYLVNRDAFAWLASVQPRSRRLAHANSMEPWSSNSWHLS